MTAMNMGPALPMSVTMMAAMMLPSAVPAVTRLARERDGAIAAPRFAGGYLASWALVGVVVYLAYRPPAAIAAGVLVIGAGLYELTPLKRECRRRCREHVRSGLRFGVYCFGSSIGLMLVLIAVDVMSIALMVVIAVVVLAQKLFAPHPAVDVPLALAIVVLGIAIAAT
jgi:predicted metal-binding membrane protein